MEMRTQKGRPKVTQKGNEMDDNTNNFMIAEPDAIDPTTGFLSRSVFYNFITNMLALTSLEKKSLVLLSVKLTDYKRISALWEKSESAGIINASAKIIADVLRSRAVCVRLSEDTYVVVAVTEDDGVATANSIKEELTFRFDKFNKLSSKDYTLNPIVSAMTVNGGEEMSPEDVFVAMLARSREIIDYTPQSRYAVSAEGEDSPELTNVVNRILDNNDIDYHFQPIVSAKTGDVVGYEALMRMPQKYGVSPLTLLKFASELNRLGDVERATLFNVMKKMKKLEKEIGDRKVFINSIPGHYLSDEEFKQLVKKYGSLFDRVVIEVTEETNIEDNTLQYLSSRTKEYGFQVAVDDFGTGYSNVKNLLKFLPNYVKIDRFLISELHLDPRKQHFVNTIIQFAHDNGFNALAEGVETMEELNAVIGMGVDLIQGFYTAKPAPEPLQALPQELLAEISRANLDMVSNNSRQKVFIVKDETTLSLVDLSLQKYNAILLSGGDITLVGNPEFTSALSIRVKDHSDCRLTIRDVNIGDVDATPCIDIGKGSSLTLNVEGFNILTGNGIRVPESTQINLEGSGILQIKPTFTNAYGIGNEYNSAFGRIVSEMNGTLEIVISGENCVCIGGKSSEAERAIDLRCGVFKSVCAASNCVSIGSFKEKTPIYIKNMDISIDVRIDKGAMVGSMFGDQDTHISNTLLRIFGSGSKVAGLGSIEETSGRICVNDSTIDVSLKGWNITEIGAEKGDLIIDCNHSRILLTGEGNTSIGMGCRDKRAEIRLDNVGVDMCLFSANCTLFGCKPENFKEGENAYNIKRDGSMADRRKWFK